jgi:hypothetical protein
MNSDDREEVRGMLNDIISAPLEKIEGQYRLMTNQLSNIEIQTIRTNSRVTKLEDKVVVVENYISGNKLLKSVARKRFEIFLKIFGAIVILVGLGFSVYFGFKSNENTSKTLDNTVKINNNVESQGMPFITNSRGEPALLKDTLKIYYWPTDSSYLYIIQKVKKDE